MIDHLKKCRILYEDRFLFHFFLMKLKEYENTFFDLSFECF